MNDVGLNQHTSCFLLFNPHVALSFSSLSFSSSATPLLVYCGLSVLTASNHEDNPSHLPIQLDMVHSRPSTKLLLPKRHRAAPGTLPLVSQRPRAHHLLRLGRRRQGRKNARHVPRKWRVSGQQDHEWEKRHDVLAQLLHQQRYLGPGLSGRMQGDAREQRIYADHAVRGFADE